MRSLRKDPEGLDGQLKDRPNYCLPVDGFRTDSTALSYLTIDSTHHCVHNANNKRASMQLYLTNTHMGTILGFTGKTEYADQPHLEIRDIPDLNATYIPDWNPLSAFADSHMGKQMDGYLLCDDNPKAPIGPLTKSNRPTTSPSRTVLDELIELMGASPYKHFIVLTIRAKTISEYEEEIPESDAYTNKKIADIINWFRNKSDANLDESDRAYHIQPAELIAYSDQQTRPSEPLISRLTDLSTSDHEYSYERMGAELAADKIAYARTDIKRHLPKRLFYRTDGKKRTLDLLEQDMDNILQRRKHPNSDDAHRTP